MAYSQDLRKRIIATVERGEGSLRQIAQRFLVSLSFVTRLLHHYRTTGSLEPKPHGGGRPPALGPAQLKRLRALIRKKPDATLEELRRGLGVDCSTMAIVRALQKLKITRKKKVLHAQERDTPEGQQKRRDFLAAIAGIDPRDRLVFVDESGAKTSMTRTHGRAPVGERVHGAVPGHWDSVTLICGLAALGGDGAGGVPRGHGHGRVPELRRAGAGARSCEPEDVVIWDNLKPHKAQAVVAAVEQAGARGHPAAAVEPGPDADRGDVLEGQGGVAVGGGAIDVGAVCGDRLGVARGLSAGHPGMVPIPCGVRLPIVRRSSLFQAPIRRSRPGAGSVVWWPRPSTWPRGRTRGSWSRRCRPRTERRSRCTRGTTAAGARWRTGSRSSSCTCSPTGPAPTMRANQVRLFFSSIAYVLLEALRRLGLAGTELAEAQCQTIRLKLLKIGALVRVTVRKVWVKLSSGSPYAEVFRRVHANLARLRPPMLRC